jgi:DNA-directed RNA polymerase specialized sigma24 family protein
MGRNSSVVRKTLLESLPRKPLLDTIPKKPLVFFPRWEGEIEGWACKYIGKNLWRYRPDLEFDDLYQEAYLVFQRVADKYLHVSEPRHLMALFKMAVRRQFIDIVKARSIRVRLVSFPDAETDDPEPGDASLYGVDSVPDDRDWVAEADFRLRLEELPMEVRRLVRRARREGQLDRRAPDGRRETTNEFLCRIAGVSPDCCDLREALARLVGVTRGPTRSGLATSKIS